jgi:hypothetical protein
MKQKDKTAGDAYCAYYTEPHIGTMPHTRYMHLSLAIQPTSCTALESTLTELPANWTIHQIACCCLLSLLRGNAQMQHNRHHDEWFAQDI